MDFAKRLHFIFPSPVLLIISVLLSGNTLMGGNLSAQPIERALGYQSGELAAPLPSTKLNGMLVQTVSSLSVSNQRLFSPRPFFGQSSPVYAGMDTQTADTERNPVAEWLEVTLNPVYQWLRGLRRRHAEKQSLESNVTGEEDNLPFASQLADISSKKLNQAITAATDQYQGVLLSVKRLTIEQAIYRIKILRQSGELHTLDYSEEQDQFISEGDEDWYANTVD